MTPSISTSSSSPYHLQFLILTLTIWILQTNQNLASVEQATAGSTSPTSTTSSPPPDPLLSRPPLMSSLPMVPSGLLCSMCALRKPKYVIAEATVAKYSEWTTILQYELSQNVRMCIKHIKDKSTHGYLSFIIPQNLQEMDNCLLDKPCKEWAYATMLQAYHCSSTLHPWAKKFPNYFFFYSGFPHFVLIMLT